LDFEFLSVEFFKISEKMATFSTTATQQKQNHQSYKDQIERQYRPHQCYPQKKQKASLPCEVSVFLWKTRSSKGSSPTSHNATQYCPP
jgi:hypothetical protein